MKFSQILLSTRSIFNTYENGARKKEIVCQLPFKATRRSSSGIIFRIKKTNFIHKNDRCYFRYAIVSR